MARYFILVNSAGVYVKDGDFFKSQGGLAQAWGKSWKAINAASLNDARQIGIKRRRKQFPNSHRTLGEAVGDRESHPASSGSA